MSVSITRIVKFIRKGKGVIVARSRNVYNYTYKEWTQFYGLSGRSVNWDGIINVSDFSVGDTMVINGTVSDKQRITISLYAKVTAIDTNRAIITAQSLYYIASGENGAKGDRGPALRGPQAWSDCAVGYVFQSGASGEEYKDIVLYGNNYYSCIKSHTKTASNNPGSATDTNSGLWKLADKLEIVATKILLAQYALVKNLGVEAIDMKDAEGNIIFQAKDGNVTCKSGIFENVTVAGDITAKSIRLHISSSITNIDGAVVFGEWKPIILPELPNGECMNIKIYAPFGTRSSPEASVAPQNSKVKIWVHSSKNLAQSKEIGLGYGLFDVVGIGQDGQTIWAIR